VRIGSTNRGDQTVTLTGDEESQGMRRIAIIENTQVLPNVAFQTPEGKTVLIVANDTGSVSSFGIQYAGQFANIRLSPGAVGTYIW
jgi:glucosylceramidase